MHELFRQPLRINKGETTTMVDMVSDLTGLVRSYSGNWQRPLGELRKEFHKARKLGSRIVRIVSERSWRQAALEDVLQSLRVQDEQMHHHVSNILIDARADQHIAQQKELHDQLHVALQGEDKREIWEVSKQLYRLSHQTLDFLDSDPSHNIAFTSKLKEIRKEDPVLQRRIIYTLNEVAGMQNERPRRAVPNQRSVLGAIEVYSSI